MKRQPTEWEKILANDVTKKGLVSKIYKYEMNAICGNMDRPRDCHTEWSKSDREREVSCDIAYMQNLKKDDTSEHIYKTETDSQT